MVMILRWLCCAQSLQSKSDAAVFESKKAVVGDGHKVAVASQLFENAPGSRRREAGLWNTHSIVSAFSHRASNVAGEASWLSRR